MVSSTCDRRSLKSLESPRTPKTHSRRPSFFRKRSKSVPGLAWASIPMAEASIIFSTAETATARRRRPNSEYSPGEFVWQYANRLPSIEQYSFTPHSPVTKQEPFPRELINNPYFSSPPPARRSFTPVSPTFPIDILSLHEEPEEMIYDEEPSFNDSTDEDLTPSDHVSETEAAIDIFDDVFTTPVRSFQSHRNHLRDYAAGLRQFTQHRLEVFVPTVTPKPLSQRNDSAVENSYFFNFSPPATPVNSDTTSKSTNEHSESQISSPRRPELISHFSDWSQASNEEEQPEWDMDEAIDIDISANMPRSYSYAALTTPEQSPRSSRVYPDSELEAQEIVTSCEATPRVGYFRNDSLDAHVPKSRSASFDYCNDDVQVQLMSPTMRFGIAQFPSSLHLENNEVQNEVQLQSQSSQISPQQQLQDIFFDQSQSHYFEPTSYFEAWSTDNSTANSPWPLKPPRVTDSNAPTTLSDLMLTSTPQLPPLLMGTGSGLTPLFAPMSLRV